MKLNLIFVLLVGALIVSLQASNFEKALISTLGAQELADIATYSLEFLQELPTSELETTAAEAATLGINILQVATKPETSFQPYVNTINNGISYYNDLPQKISVGETTKEAAFEKLKQTLNNGMMPLHIISNVKGVPEVIQGIPGNPIPLLESITGNELGTKRPLNDQERQMKLVEYVMSKNEGKVIQEPIDLKNTIENLNMAVQVNGDLMKSVVDHTAKTPIGQGLIKELQGQNPITIAQMAGSKLGEKIYEALDKALEEMGTPRNPNDQLYIHAIGVPVEVPQSDLSEPKSKTDKKIAKKTEKKTKEINKLSKKLSKQKAKIKEKLKSLKKKLNKKLTKYQGKLKKFKKDLKKKMKKAKKKQKKKIKKLKKKEKKEKKKLKKLKKKRKEKQKNKSSKLKLPKPIMPKIDVKKDLEKRFRALPKLKKSKKEIAKAKAKKRAKAVKKAKKRAKKLAKKRAKAIKKAKKKAKKLAKKKAKARAKRRKLARKRRLAKKKAKAKKAKKKAKARAKAKAKRKARIKARRKAKAKARAKARAKAKARRRK